MSYTPPVISYATTVDGTYTALTGVQNATVRRGREYSQDPFSATSLTVELIPANSYTTPIEVGQYIDVREANNASSPAWFTGRISDVERRYGLPYNSGTGAAPADRIFITALGGVGVAGQSGTLNFAGTGDGREVLDIILDNDRIIVNNTIGISPVPNTFGVSVTVDSATDGRNLFEIVNQILAGSQAIIDDSDFNRSGSLGFEFVVEIYQPPALRTWTLSDSSTGTGVYKYTDIVYKSAADNSFTQATVEGWTVSLANQVFSVGSAPHNSITLKTALNSTSQMLSLAGYVVTTTNETLPTPFKVASSTQGAPDVHKTTQMNKTTDILTKTFLLGSLIEIEFRGTTVIGVLQGCTTTFYPDFARVEYNLSPYLGVPFTLDDPNAGVLDTNRLGYP
jgi:hypothetical protein